MTMKQRIYYHQLIVHVVTTEESPDKIEKLLDGVSDRETRIDARTLAENRRNGPSREIGPRPNFPEDRTKPEIARYAAECDAWYDTWPSWYSFDEAGS